MKYILLFLTLFSYSYAQFEVAPLYQPYNLSFENSMVGALPTSWTITDGDKENGYHAEATNENPHGGKYCLKLEFKSDTLSGENISGTAVQSFDATPYIGKKVRFTAYIRAEIDGPGRAGFYVSERTYQNQYPFVHTNVDDPIVFNTWEKYTVDYTVTQNAYSINMGLFLKGKGKAWIDDISVEVIDEVQDIESPSPVSKQFAENLLDFAKCYGYTKFYNPSDEIEGMDIETFLYHSIKALESSKDKTDLSKIIESRLNRIAPTVRIFSDENSASNYKLVKPGNAQDRVAVAKITNNIYSPRGNKNIGTQRLNVYDSRMSREGATYQIIGAKNLQGKKIKYSVSAKVIPYGNDAHAELWFRVDYKDPAKPPMNIKMPEIITSDQWKDYSMDIEIPEDAQQIRIGLVMMGEGRTWFDNVRLSENKKNVDIDYHPKNNSFDKKWKPNDIEYWRIPESIVKSGYEFVIDTSKESMDGSSLLIYTNKENYVPLPKPGEICNKKIEDNMWLSVPLTLYDDGSSTLPKSKLEAEPHISMNPDDRVTKIATFIEMWDYFQTYSALSLTDEQWDNIFIDNISKLADSKTTEEYVSLLNQILKVTNNIRSEAWLTKPQKDFTLPFIVDFVDGEVVIIKSLDKQIEAGDKLISIGGKNLSKYLEEKTKQYPGNSLVWKQKKAYYNLAEGDFQSEVNLEVVRNGKKLELPITRNLTNREVHIERPLTLEWLDSNTIYIDGTRFNDFEMTKLMANFKNAKGVIVDLRGESLLSEHFLGFFIDNDISSYDWTLRTYTNPCKAPIENSIKGYIKAKQSVLPHNIVFLSNETSVGTSETILRLVKYYGIGKIVGEPTAGSYDFMQQKQLPALYNFSFDLYPIKFNTDSQIKYRPIDPDIIVTEKNDYPGDKKIIKALEILKKNY